jgi:hypothetical protein
MKKLAVASEDLDRFLSLVLKSTIIKFQEDLGSTKVSPVDEGRLRSNWFASVGTNESVTDSRNQPQLDATRLPLDWKKKYHLVNNLPYAERLAFGSYAVSQPPNWFPAYFNANGQKVVNGAVRKAVNVL